MFYENAYYFGNYNDSACNARTCGGTLLESDCHNYIFKYFSGGWHL